MPQPNLVPVRCNPSRRAQSSGVSGATSSDVVLPLTERESMWSRCLGEAYNLVGKSGSREVGKSGGRGVGRAGGREVGKIGIERKETMGACGPCRLIHQP